MKNITLSAEEHLIRRAREKALREKTTLNQEFRFWLEKYTDEKAKGKSYLEIMDKLEYVKLKRKPSREEMNER